MIVYLARDIPAFVMYCVNGESVMIIDYHSNKSIIVIYNIIDYVNRLIVPALVNTPTRREEYTPDVDVTGNYDITMTRLHSRLLNERVYYSECN